jgi:Ca2+-transporting ATPase
MMIADEDDGLRKARTMVILFIVFAELLRAYTSRSQRVSIFTMGPFSNKWMQPATGIAVVLTCAMVNIPVCIRHVMSCHALLNT